MKGSFCCLAVVAAALIATENGAHSQSSVDGVFLNPSPALRAGISTFCAQPDAFGRRIGSDVYSWVGRIESDNCEQILLRNDPRMIEFIHSYAEEEFENCVDNRANMSGSPDAVLACEEMLQNVSLGDPGYYTWEVFVLASIGCAIATLEIDPDLVDGVCVIHENQVQDVSSWRRIVSSEYVGPNLHIGDDFNICDDPADDRPSTPLATQIAELVPRGRAIEEIVDDLTEMGFLCEFGQYQTEQYPGSREILCSQLLGGFRWRRNVEAAGGIQSRFYFSDTFNITLSPDESGVNQRTCAWVDTIGL